MIDASMLSNVAAGLRELERDDVRVEQIWSATSSPFVRLAGITFAARTTTRQRWLLIPDQRHWTLYHLAGLFGDRIEAGLMTHLVTDPGSVAAWANATADIYEQEASRRG